MKILEGYEESWNHAVCSLSLVQNTANNHKQAKDRLPSWQEPILSGEPMLHCWTAGGLPCSPAEQPTTLLVAPSTSTSVSAVACQEVVVPKQSIECTLISTRTHGKDCDRASNSPPEESRASTLFIVITGTTHSLMHAKTHDNHCHTHMATAGCHV